MKEKPFNPPLPKSALGPVLGGAARFITEVNETPYEMAVANVLAAVFLVCQGLYKVTWREGKSSPLNEYFWCDAVSSEGKTEVYELAFLTILAFEAQQTALKKIFVKEFENRHLLWYQKVKTTRRHIAKLFAQEKCTADAEAHLNRLMSEEPQPRKFAQFRMTDTTAQAVPVHLDSEYPYAILITDEVLVLLESGALSNVGMLNQMWSASRWQTKRVTRKSIDLKNVCLSIFIQGQPKITNGYLKKNGQKLHDSGFLSRINYMRPKSMVGNKSDKPIERRNELIEPYYARLRALLSLYEGPDIPQQKELFLTEAARQELARYRLMADKASGEGGHFERMGGAALKSPEHAARFAAILHIINGNEGPINLETIKNGIKIAAWFLNQHRLYLLLPSQLELDAMELAEWIGHSLIPRCKGTSFDGPMLSRLVPPRFRGIVRLREVLQVLEADGKVKICGEKNHPWTVVLPGWFPQAPFDPREVIGDCGNLKPGLRLSFFTEEEQLAIREYINPSTPIPQPDPRYCLWPGAYLE
ncbi:MULTISPECIES: DUF3987 domain-containing protein [Polaromonas]|uniref:DUF3987 domain-containing protein n=1 Tax=Polaromonas aquatica TaxID=332657 RepID=A0ABW1U7P2_9BURK